MPKGERTPDTKTRRDPSMTFFTPDLYRRFGLGFLIGAALIAVSNAQTLSDQVSPPAQAAETPQAPQSAPEFLIQPIN